MKKSFRSLCIFALGGAMACLYGCSSTPKGTVTCIPNYPISQGVSAPFAGFIQDEMVLAGGCNFPDVPAAEGGKKVYYDSSFTYSVKKQAASWTNGVQLPFAVAYGATIELENEIICIGGMNAQSSLKEVFSISKDPEISEWRVKTLPSLPESIDNAAAAKIGQTIYVTGGNQGEKGKNLYSYCVGKDSIWNKLSVYPGPKRIQPVLLATEDALYLFGGFAVNAETKESMISSDYLIYDVKVNQWREPKAVPTMADGSPRALVGCSGVRVGDRFIIAGGVNYAIFKAAVEGNSPKDYMTRPIDWYRFSKDVLVYNFKTDGWTVVSDVEGYNKAGGILLYSEPNLYMVCGEKKPGIRTPEIVACPLDRILKKSK